MKVKFAIAFLAIAMLCVTALAQEKTADYWIKIGDDLALNKSNNQEALAAYDMAIDQDPMYSNAWQGKGEAQRALGKFQDAFESFYVAGKLGYEK